MGDATNPTSAANNAKNLFVSHISALRYWRQPEGTAMGKRSRARSLAKAITSVKEARRLMPAEQGLIMKPDYPLHVLVPGVASRRYAKGFQPHVWQGEVPYGAFLKIAPNIYVSSPEFVFVQLASQYSLVELAQIGNELCGGYYLNAISGFEQRPSNTPLTSRRKLLAFIDKVPKARGAKKARRALEWVADHCNSPQETIGLMALCLPPRRGGWSLPMPDVNKTVRVGKRMAKYVGGSTYTPDYMWKAVIGGKTVHVAGEYDSSEHHDEDQAAENTRIRRNDMKSLGYLVTSINKSQIARAELLQYPARQIARDLGIYKPPPNREALAKQNELLALLRQERFR